MDSEGIVEVLNRKFEAMKCKDGVHFILHKRVEDKPIKAYKEYRFTLWYVSRNTKYPVTCITYTSRVVTESEKNNIIRHMEEQLLMNIYSLLQDNINLNSMLDGSFTGYKV